MIYIIKHRECETPKLKGYKTLKVGDICDYLDEDNINHLNNQLSELTGIYQINKYNDEIKGQVHYRRYFLDENGDVLSFDKAKELLKEYDIIITERYIVGDGIYHNLRREIGDVDSLDRVYYKLIEINPDFKQYFDKTYFSPRQMFICNKKLYKKYCDWIFPLLLPIMDEIKSDKPRFYSYIIERLLNYWIDMNNLKAIELPYNETGDRLC